MRFQRNLEMNKTINSSTNRIVQTQESVKSIDYLWVSYTFLPAAKRT